MSKNHANPYTQQTGSLRVTISNNQTTTASRTYNQFLSDLVITIGCPTASKSSMLAGTQVTLSSWTEANQGNAASGFFDNGFYLSTN